MILSTAGMMKTGQALVQKPQVVHAQIVSWEIQPPINSLGRAAAGIAVAAPGRRREEPAASPS